MHGVQEDPRELVKNALREFGRRRIEWYDDPGRISLDRLLLKDVLMFAARGVLTADEFVEEAFRAFESSSEESVMGTLWQEIITGLSSDTLDTGDLTTQRDEALWVCELKAQYNTINSSSAVQELRDLKQRAEETSRYRRATNIPVKAAFCVLRGTTVDETRVYVPRRHGENEDLRGFEYRYIRGSALWEWLTGYATPLELVGDCDDLDTDDVRAARDRCLMRLKSEMANRLAEHGLGSSINDVLKLV